MLVVSGSSCSRYSDKSGPVAGVKAISDPSKESTHVEKPLLQLAELLLERTEGCGVETRGPRRQVR